jgi:hypothetical protein
MVRFVAAVARRLSFSTIEFASGPHKLILTITKRRPLCARSEQSNDAKDKVSNGVPGDKQDIGGSVGKESAS